MNDYNRHDPWDEPWDVGDRDGYEGKLPPDRMARRTDAARRALADTAGQGWLGTRGDSEGYYAPGSAPDATDAEAREAHQAKWEGTPELAEAVSDSHVCGVAPANPVCCGDDPLANVYHRSDEGRQWYRDSAASLARRRAERGEAGQ